MKKRNLLLIGLFLFLGIPVLGLISLSLSRGGSSPSLTKGRAVGGAAPSVVTSMGMAEIAADQYAAAPGEPAMQKMRSTTMIAPDIMPPVPGDTGFAPGTNRTIVKNANLSLVVDDTRKAVEQITQLTSSVNGIVTSANIYESPYASGGINANLVMRVPVDKLDNTLEQLRKMASKVLQDSVTAEDRTKQKVDLEARIKNLKASEEQLMVIMRQAKNVQETLEVQRQLTEVRSQIEVMTAQLENLTGDAAMSTVTVSLSNKEADLPTVGPQQNSIVDEIKLAIKDMIRLYRDLFVVGVRAVILLLPVIILAIIGWFVWQRRSRKS